MKMMNETHSLDGLILLNKPKGVTSFQEINMVKKILGVSKCGHAGTLDKNAEGLLLLCLGKATKLMKFLVGFDKKYEAEIQFGAATSTDDACGEVIKQHQGNAPIEFSIIKKHLTKYIGEMEQVPPDYSAIHVDGKRAYKIALAGKGVHLKSRRITIYENKIISFQNSVLTIEILCSSGTYVRSIARDLGKDTGYFAYILNLKRTKAGPFCLENASTREEIAAQNFHLIPPIGIVDFLPSLMLKEEYESKLKNGFPLHENMFKNSSPIDGYHKIIYQNQLIAIIKKENHHFQYDLVY